MYVATATEMEKSMFYNQLDRLSLFKELTNGEAQRVCECLGANPRQFKKGETVISEGGRVKQFGIVLGGRAESFKSDPSGRRFTVAVINEGGYIGILLAGLADSQRRSPVTVIATDRLTVLFVPFDKLVRPCSNACKAHTKVLSNFIEAVSDKALFLFQRMDCLVKPNIRQKVLTYLHQAALEQQSNTVELEFDREGLGDYLNVERSALSRELSNMKKDGWIDYYRNVFKLLHKVD